jgi:hypothetical protein
MSAMAALFPTMGWDLGFRTTAREDIVPGSSSGDDPDAPAHR